MGGALAGASLGTAACPGVGTLVGGITGAFAGGLTGGLAIRNVPGLERKPLEITNVEWNDAKPPIFTIEHILDKAHYLYVIATRNEKEVHWFYYCSLPADASEYNLNTEDRGEFYKMVLSGSEYAIRVFLFEEDPGHTKIDEFISEIQDSKPLQYEEWKKKICKNNV